MTPANPLWLILLVLIPLLVIAAVLAARTRRKIWSAFVAARLRPRLLRRSSPVPRWIAFGCLLAAFALLVIALSRPQGESGRESEKILGRNLIFMLDLSRSMQVRDVQPSRLAQAKATAYELLEALPNDRVGVIGFTATPYLFAPLTVDHNAVRETISQLDTEWLPTGASDIAAGLELGIETLKETGVRQNAIVLLTDGEQTAGDLIPAAEKAKAAGIEVITIGFGTEAGDFIPDDSFADGRFRDRSGREVISRLETDNLREISQLTGGRFAIASSGADIPAMVKAAAADLDREELKSRETTVMTEYFQWFLLPTIVLLIGSVVAATRWRGLHAATQAARATGLAIFVTALLAAPEAGAARQDDARRAMAAERYGDAAAIFGELAEKHADSEKGFRYQLARATAAYHAGDWPTARRGFSEALRAEDSQVRAAAHHGLGNTLFEIGWARLSGGPRYPQTPGAGGAGDEEDDETPSDSFDQLSDALLNKPDPESSSPPGNFDAFEGMTKERLGEWLAEEPDESGNTEGRRRFEKLVTDWIDSVDHFDDAGSLEAAAHNRDVAYRHLEKLRAILRELEQNAQQIQALPEPEDRAPSQPGDEPKEPSEPGEKPGEPEEGEEQGKQPDGESEEEQPGENGEQKPGESGDESHENQADGSDSPPGPPPEPEETETPEPRPDETPEETARRVLKENADLQKGALAPGRQRFRRPEKDW